MTDRLRQALHHSLLRPMALLSLRAVFLRDDARLPGRRG